MSEKHLRLAGPHITSALIPKEVLSPQRRPFAAIKEKSPEYTCRDEFAKPDALAVHRAVFP